jgi:hypothetical protein
VNVERRTPGAANEMSAPGANVLASIVIMVAFAVDANNVAERHKR